MRRALLIGYVEERANPALRPPVGIKEIRPLISTLRSDPSSAAIDRNSAS
jgi:hypothetical protein